MNNRVISALILTKFSFFCPWMCVMYGTYSVAHISPRFTLISTRSGVRAANSHIAIQCTLRWIASNVSKVEGSFLLISVLFKSGFHFCLFVQKSRKKTGNYSSGPPTPKVWVRVCACARVCAESTCSEEFHLSPKIIVGKKMKQLLSWMLPGKVFPLDYSPLSYGYVLWLLSPHRMQLWVKLLVCCLLVGCPVFGSMCNQMSYVPSAPSSIHIYRRMILFFVPDKCSFFSNWGSALGKQRLKKFTEVFSLWLRGLRIRHSIHEDVDLIPGLTRWVKDLALMQAAA